MAKPKPKPKPIWKRILGVTAYAGVCVAIVGAGSMARIVNSSPIISSITNQVLRHTPPQQIFNQSSINLLVLGCDEDLAPGGKKILKAAARSDMMMVARLDFAHRRITGLSIPRDMLVRLPGYPQHKMNAFHAIGGNDLAQKAVEHVLGISIDRTVTVQYPAFQDLVNLVGGIEVFVKKPLKYTDKAGGLFIDIKSGRQHLDGYNAMCFVRYRHGDSDFARQERQRDFMLAFKDAVLHHPNMIGAVANQAKEVFGGTMDNEEMASLALFARSVGSDNIKMGQVPVVQEGRYSIYLDRRNLKRTLKQFNFAQTEKTAFRFED